MVNTQVIIEPQGISNTVISLVNVDAANTAYGMSDGLNTKPKMGSFQSTRESSAQPSDKFDQYLHPIAKVEKSSAFEMDDFWSGLALRKEDVDKMANDKFLIPNILVNGHVAAFIAHANGGKTTIFRYFCEKLVRKGMRVFYINVDGNTGDLKRHFDHAKKFGYTVISPDARDGKSTVDAIEKFKELAESDQDLTGHVYIVDTLKKFVNMLNKPELKGTLQMFRKLSVKGATIALLGHANKYNDKDGKPVYEGTADLRNDVDELIYLISSKDDLNKTQDITTMPDKVRSIFEPVSYRIELGDDRKVYLLDEVLKPMSEGDKELICLINESISIGDDSQSDIISYVNDRSSHGKNKIRVFLLGNSVGDDAVWVKTQTGSNNTLRYTIRQDVVLPLSG